jgi:uncharacterized protein (TIGR02145 family)
MKKKSINNWYRLLMLLLFFLNMQFATAQLFGGSLKSNKNRVFSGGTFNGDTYNLVTSTTGKVWLDRNLGAAQVATSSTDAASYGDLYQWGRAADGHESRTSVTTSTLSSTDTPGNSSFILASGSSPNDWHSGQNASLWQGVNGTNNPCPTGFRLPMETEIEAERNNGGSGFWGTGSPQSNAAGAFASVLKLTMSGRRMFDDGLVTDLGTRGDYWSSTVNGIYSRFFFLGTSGSATYSNWRTFGYAVRCIKGEESSGGTAVVSSYVSTSSAGTMTAGTAVTGVTQIITATVATVGTYNISTTANGVTFTGTGTFAGSGSQNIILTATGTPTAAGSNDFILNTSINLTFSRTTAAPYTIGESALGGKIAYILVSGDAGYDASVQHGLVVATTDQSSGIRWFNGSYTTTGATGTAIGTGFANTNTIITSQGATATSYAAGLARAHNGGGFTDWYLPSKDELDKLYDNRVAISGFNSAFYWSSSENGSMSAWEQSFVNGDQNDNFKFSTYNVRAVRAF